MTRIFSGVVARSRRSESKLLPSMIGLVAKWFTLSLAPLPPAGEGDSGAGGSILPQTRQHQIVR